MSAAEVFPAPSVTKRAHVLYTPSLKVLNVRVVLPVPIEVVTLIQDPE